VQACGELLSELGYAATTTNRIAERAGVNIASLYEYFPGKDAIVAQVAERLFGRVLRRLAEGAATLRAAPPDEVIRRWVHVIYETVAGEQPLVGVLAHQVPYAAALETARASSARLLAFTERLHRHAGDLARRDISRVEMQLIVNLTSSTILQLVLDPPEGLSARQVLDELGDRLETWIR